MKSSTLRTVAQSKLSDLMITLGMGLRVKKVLASELAQNAIADKRALLHAIRSWLVTHNDPNLFGLNEKSRHFNKCLNLVQRLASRTIVGLQRVHGKPPKYSKESHQKVWEFWIRVCELKSCPFRRVQLN